MPYQLGLPAALARYGLAVDLVPGAETRGSANFNPKGSVSHWTAGARTGDRGSLKICIDGRPDLSGPLCNTFLPRGLTVATQRVLVVAMGRANHAGAGGWKGLLGNSAVWGTEAENSGNGEWTDWQRWAYPRINAAYADLSSFDETYCCGHHEWAPTRKKDITDWPMPGMRSAVKSLLAGKGTLRLGDRVLQIGSAGPDVREAQTLLGIAVDGIYGPGTQAAVRAAQTAHGLPADGDLGPRTLSALRATPIEEDDMFSDADRAALKDAQQQAAWAKASTDYLPEHRGIVERGLAEMGQQNAAIIAGLSKIAAGTTSGVDAAEFAKAVLVAAGAAITDAAK